MARPQPIDETTELPAQPEGEQPEKTTPEQRARERYIKQLTKELESKRAELKRKDERHAQATASLKADIAHREATLKGLVGAQGS